MPGRRSVILTVALLLTACDSGGSAEPGSVPTSALAATSTVSTTGGTPAPTTAAPTTAVQAPPETSEPEPGDAAVWTVDPAGALTVESTSFTARVTRLGCSGGITGQVFPPAIELRADAIVVTFLVEHIPGGECPGNNAVPFDVTLPEPVGNRPILDGACAPGARAATTAFCVSGGERWDPADGNGGPS